MAFQQYHRSLYLSSKCYPAFSVPFLCRKRSTHVSFLAAVNGVRLGLTLENGAISIREPKFSRDFYLEGEIFEFMKNSPKPDSFPTKEELVAAERMDLVNAIVAEGGWLSAGWDKNEGEVHLEIGRDNGVALRNPGASLPSDSLASCSSSVLSKCSPLGGSIDVKHSDGGIEGILSRLEKERAASYALESREGDGSGSRREGIMGETTYSWGSLAKMYGGKLTKSSEEGNMDGQKNYRESYEQSICSDIWELESELSSMIHLVRCGTDDWSEEHGNSLEKLHDLSDAWEFQENEIMESHVKLRSTRAKLSILEGKLALELMEAQKAAEEKQNRIEEAQWVLSLLRTTCIVWPNPGNDVFLVGSFDGWTSQRRMERTSSGVFVLNLMLYPGRYEIKFVVDGIWRVDPLRTVVNNNGHENSLLIVS